MLWCGDSNGYTRSFTPQPALTSPFPSTHSIQLIPYTKFKSSINHPINQLLNHQRGILSLSSNNINFNNRRGLCQLSLNAESINNNNFKNLKCMTFNCHSINDLVIGGNNSLSKVSLLKPTVLESFDYTGDLSFINNLSKFLTLGKSNGTVEIFDPLDNKVVKSFHGHNGLLSDLDVSGNYIATCGYSLRPRRNNHLNNNHPNSLNNPPSPDYMVDPLVNIYDLRMMRPLPPIPFSAGASFARFHPKLPNIIIISSSTGQLQFVDIYDQSNVYLYQANLSNPLQHHHPRGSLAAAISSPASSSCLSNMNISENGEYLVFNDGFSNVHLWSLLNNPNKNFLNFPSSLDQPDIVMQSPSLNPLPVDSNVPLNSIGMPYYKEFLLSNYPTDLVFQKELAKLPIKIDPSLFEISEQIALEPHVEQQQQHQQHQPLHIPKFMAFDKLKYSIKGRNTYQKYESLKNSKLSNGGKKTTTTTIMPKFLSERGPIASPIPSVNNSTANLLTKTVSNTSHDPDKSSNDDEQFDTSIFQYKSEKATRVPNVYLKLQIQYSKFGVEDFDFDFYNKTLTLNESNNSLKIPDDRFCGLENNVDNSYINSLIQLYRFCPIFYNSVIKNLLPEYLPNNNTTIITNKNPQGLSILIELGYLFDMMYKSHGEQVKISNFTQVLNQNKRANDEGLINIDELRSLSGYDLQKIIINFNKFLIDTISHDQLNQIKSLLKFDFYEFSNVEKIGNLFNIVFDVEVRSNGCESYDQQLINQLSLDLINPPQNVLNKMKGNQGFAKKNHSLITYLEYTANRVKIVPCNNHPYPPQFLHSLEIKQTLVQLPPILSINLPFNNQEYSLIKGFKKWLVPEFYVVKNPVNKKISFKPVVTQFNQEASKYDLLGYVCEINHDLDNTKGEHNLISYIKIKSSANSYFAKDQWFLFNDFLVMPISEEEVFNINYSWKKPTILCYHNVDHPLNQTFNYLNQSIINKIKLNDSILYRDHFACGIRENYKREYKILTRDEAPSAGTLVSIDAEFVTLKPEELEVSYDGFRNLVKPKVLSLARISVIRGDNNDQQGVPFIDDYILHTCPIYDYLTNFSGIEPNDLNPIKSEKNLVTLQTAYRKLWILINLGVIFVGHGLKNDFRTINLKVPQSQIRDTIDYFYLPDFKRKLSLKFLAYILLKEKVQTGNHDSIEDAYTALLLYKKYIELNAIGEFESTLHRIYLEGQQLRFKVPES